MPVKNTDTGEVHKGSKGGTTGCGFDTSEPHWVSASGTIDGCKN